MTRFALLLAALTACAKDNPYYCDEQCQARPDGGSGSAACVTDDDCPGATPVCDTAQSACVTCTASDVGACAGATPVCVAATNTCAPCAAHDECSSDACLPNGECGTDSSVAYVATSGTDTGTCGKATPCATLTYAAQQRAFVKLQNNIDEVVTLNNVTTTVLAEAGTTIKRTLSNGPIITVAGNSTVTLKTVIIRDAATSVGHGISVGTGDNNVKLTLDDVAVLSNTGLGLSIGGGTLTISRSLVANNYGGGAVVVADFEITNSMFVANGTASSTYGGVVLTPGTTKHDFSFNTVADNMSSNSVGRGINCSYPVAIASTILKGNAPNGCSFDYSLFDTNLTVTGANNKVGNPQFKNTNASQPLAADFYRIANNSDAIDGAVPSSSVMTDIDGDDRPQGGVRDIGADEYK
jgi:hypothetical protein